MRSILSLLLLLTATITARASLCYIGSGAVMAPTLMPAELVDIVGAPFSELASGEIIAFQVKRDDVLEIVAHRLVRLEGASWVTRADGNTFDDPWRVNEGMYLGRVSKRDAWTRYDHARSLPKRLERMYVLNPYTVTDPILLSQLHLDSLPPVVIPGGGSPPRTPPGARVPDGGSTLGYLGAALVVGLLARWNRRRTP